MRKLAVLLLLLWGCILAAQQPQDLQTVLQQLQSQDNATRLQAIERAPEFGAAIIPHLPSLLTHQDWRIQRAGQIVLENIATRTAKLGAKERRDVVNALLALTKPNQPIPVRKAAVNALGICGTDEAVQTLASLLKDEKVRYDALAALKQIGSPAAAKAVADAAATAKGEWKASIVGNFGRNRAT